MDFFKDIVDKGEEMFNKEEEEEEKKGFGIGDVLSLAGVGGDEKKKKEDGGFSSMISQGCSMLGGGGDDKGGLASVIDGISNVSTMSKVKKVFSADGTDEAVSEAKNLDKKDVDNLITMAKDLDKDDLGKVLSFLK